MSETATAAPTGIDAHFYLAKDMPRALAFYRDVIGLTASRDYADGQFVEFDLPDGSTFGLGIMPDSPWHQSGGVMFAVDDVDGAFERVRAAGVKVHSALSESPICWSAWFEDTEGNTVSLHKRKARA